MITAIMNYYRQAMQTWKAENKSIAEKRREELRQEFQAKANKRFNLIEEGGKNYIVLDGVKITTEYDEQLPLAQRMINLRKMYIEDKMVGA